MRVLLFTGKGGVGKTTVAAATALRAAAAGHRTVVVSTDPAHSLADAFDVPLGDEPTTVAPRVVGQQLDARARFEEAWDDVRRYLVRLFDWAGADAVEAEELAVVPGLEEVFALADLRRWATADDVDLVVVDCAPTAETIRLLSLPDVLAWYMDRLFAPHRRLTRLVRPAVAAVTSAPVAGDEVFAGVQRFYERLDGVRELLTDGNVTTARLVVNAERMVVAEARRTFTYLSLFGYHVDAVVANRLLPAAVDDPWFAEWKSSQAAHLDAIEHAFAPVPVLRADLAGRELVGVERLRDFGADLWGTVDPAARLRSAEPLRVDRRGGSLVLSLHLPFASGSDVDLARGGDEIFLAVGSHRRAVVLPDSLRRREVVAARMAGARLEVEFG